MTEKGKTPRTTSSEKEDVTDSTGIQRIIRNTKKNSHVHKCDNLSEMNKFFERSNY